MRRVRVYPSLFAFGAVVASAAVGCTSSSGGTPSAGTGGRPSGTGGIGANGGSGPGGAAGAGAQTCLPPVDKDHPAEKLSQTGCMDPTRPTEIGPTVIRYEVNSPLWSDKADKQRGMALPPGKQIHVLDCGAEPAACSHGPADTGKWVLPVGTVMVKSFLFDGKLVETRLFVHFPTEWAGFSYQWNEAQTEATLVPDEERDAMFNTGVQTVAWHYPSRFNCTKCHTPTAGWTLGPETRQMNRLVGGMNQIDRLKAMGAFDNPPSVPYPAAFASPYPSGSNPGGTVEERARSYLHANCAFCHRPDGDFADLDLRYDIPLKDTHACAVQPEKGDLNVAGAVDLDPGKPMTSVLWLRMNTPRDPGSGRTARMPQIATYVIDQAAVDLIGQWISSIPSCPM